MNNRLLTSEPDLQNWSFTMRVCLTSWLAKESNILYGVEIMLVPAPLLLGLLNHDHVLPHGSVSEPTSMISQLLVY